MKRFHRYFIQIGTWPHNIQFFTSSPGVYPSSDAAEVAAFDYLVKVRGIPEAQIMRKWIHTRQVRHMEKPGKPAVTPIDKHKGSAITQGKFAVFTGEWDSVGQYYRLWDNKALRS
jgi:hypothetical protein